MLQILNLLKMLHFQKLSKSHKKLKKHFRKSKLSIKLLGVNEIGKSLPRTYQTYEIFQSRNKNYIGI